jgi:hypothetical protein
MARVAVLTCCTETAKGRFRVRNQPLTCVELRGFEPLTPSMRTRCATGLRYSPWTASQRSKCWQFLLTADGPADSRRLAGAAHAQQLRGCGAG